MASRRMRLVSGVGFASSPRAVVASSACRSTVRVPDIDESMRSGRTAVTMCERLASPRPSGPARRRQELVMAADTTVELDGRIFGKPLDGGTRARCCGRSPAVLTRS